MSYNYKPFKSACLDNDFYTAIQELQYMKKNNNANFDIPFIYACEHGHIDIVKYIWKLINFNDINKLNFFDDSKSKSELFVNVCKYGNLDIIKFLLSIHNDFILHISRGFYYACINNHLHLAKYLLSIDNNNYINNKYCNYRLLYVCCEYGFLEIIKLIYKVCKNKKIYIDLFYNNFELLKISCTHSYFKLLKWFYKISKKNNIYIDISVFNNMFLYSFNSDLQIFKWIYDTHKNNDLNIYINENFKSVCLQGQLDKVKWLYEISKDIKEEFNISNYKQELKIMCLHNHIDLINWFIEIVEIESQTYADTFLYVYENNNTKMSQWFYEKYGNKFSNLIDYYNLILDCSRKANYTNNYVEFFKFLYDIAKINIKKNNHAIFKESCVFKRLEIINFLCEKIPEYSYKIENNNFIPLINNSI